MLATRRKNVHIFGKRKSGYRESYLDPRRADDVSGSTDELLRYDLSSEDDESVSIDLTSSSKYPSKSRRCCCFTLYTPNTSRFADYYHSRILQKFPFLIEMFYWIITYVFYRMTKVVSSAIFTKSIIDVAEANGLRVLEFEQFSIFSFLFPWKEYSVQQWFMHGHQDGLTILNRAYALIHIPGTVG